MIDKVTFWDGNIGWDKIPGCECLQPTMLMLLGGVGLKEIKMEAFIFLHGPPNSFIHFVDGQI